jgi:hypothetical protein
MKRQVTILGVLATAASLFSACEQVKSANPLSPAIAGPIAGVTISAPQQMSPADGAQLAVNAQPVVFTIQNAESSGVRPLSYAFEIASDPGFGTVLFSQTGVAPGDGQTSFRMPQNLAPEHTYFWRVKAQDGANESDFSAPARFQVFTPVIIGAPTLVSPADGATLTSTSATLQVNNAAVSGPAGDIFYLFEVATDPAMGNRVVSIEVAAGAGQTSFTTLPLAASTRFFWRVRAFDFARTGSFSPIRSFTTPAAASTPPPPSGGGSNGPAPNDELDLRTVTIVLGADITNWAVTSTMTSAGHNGSDLCTNHTKAGRWPALPWFDDPGVVVEGNQWMFAKIGGKWYGGAGEWLRPGQTCKNIDGHVGQGAFSGTVMGQWTPAPGETIGLAVSTPARAGQWGTAERSNVVFIRW